MMPTIRQGLVPYSITNMLFSIDLKDAYLYVPIVKHQHQFLMVCLVKKTVSVEGFATGLAIPPKDFNLLSRTILFLC